jgi:hypothetical protein
VIERTGFKIGIGLALVVGLAVSLALVRCDDGSPEDSGVLDLDPTDNPRLAHSDKGP